MSYEYSSLPGCFCARFITGRQENKNSPYGKYTGRTNLCLCLIENLCITEIIRMPLHWSILHGKGTSGDRSRTSDQTSTSCLLHILYHCFFKCHSSITFPTGISADMWECYVTATCWHFNRILLLPSSSIPRWFYCSWQSGIQNGFPPLHYRKQ